MEFEFVLNPVKPRSKSFEITLLKDKKGEFRPFDASFYFSETLLWTGLRKGPPRRLKFPEPDVVVTELRAQL